MKTYLRLLLCVLSTFILPCSYAQVTLVSNNTYLSGFVLPNGNSILTSDSTDYLYTTDGTTVSVITTSVSGDISSSVIYKNQLYFAGYTSSNDAELWTTDGTTNGTRLIKDLSANSSSSLDNFFVFNNTLYFTVNDGVNGVRLWQSDGTTSNASIVSTDVVFDSSNETNFVQNGSNVFFTTTDNNNDLGLYKLTSSGISLIKGYLGGTINLGDGIYSASLGNKLIFTIDTTDASSNQESQLWVTDGTTNGTQLIHSFASSSEDYFTLFKGLLYFYYADSTHLAIWTTDGTSANTVPFKEFEADTSFFFRYSYGGLSFPAVFNNKLYFTGYSQSTGYELWTTDGTLANTSLLKDIYPGNNSSLSFFMLDYGSLINSFFKNNTTDFSFQNAIVPFKGKLYFIANDSTHGFELWNTDGTAANTNLVKDINPDTANSLDYGEELLNSYYTTNGIYFTANDESNGVEPWVTDGTANGTHLVSDINPGKKSSNPQYNFIYNNQLYFNADNGDNTPSVDSGYGQPDLYKINQSTSALPVSLLNFTASKQTAAVLLNWTTTNEINTHHFTVERSLDGGHFTAIGTLAALGSSTSKHSYQLNDATAMQTGSTVLYYRLQSVSKDGSYSYSKVLTVQLQNGVFTFTLSPNPVHNQLTVSFSIANTTGAMLRITDAGGKQVYQQAYSSSTQSFIQQNISVARLVSGTYFIQLITDKETKTLKFIKQ